MQELEKILEEMNKIKDGNRKEKIYAKYPPNSKEQEILNAYSQGYEDGTDNFYNAIMGKIREYMAAKDTNVPTNDGWIPVEDRSPEDGETVLCTDGDYVYLVEYDADLDAPFGDIDNITGWQPSPEPYRPERSEGE